MKRDSENKRRPLANPKYDVGYGRPPTRFQFKKGVSGNPNGRPPGQTGEKKRDMDMVNGPSKGSRLTDEELLQIVKERRLSLGALLNSDLEEISKSSSNAGTKRRPPRSQD